MTEYRSNFEVWIIDRPHSRSRIYFCWWGGGRIVSQIAKETNPSTSKLWGSFLTYKCTLFIFCQLLVLFHIQSIKHKVLWCIFHENMLPKKVCCLVSHLQWLIINWIDCQPVNKTIFFSLIALLDVLAIIE